MASYAREDPIEFARLVAHWRRARGLSQEALGEIVHLSQRHISFIENGRTRPSAAVLRRIIDALALSHADGNRLLNLLGYSAAPAAEEREWPSDAPQRSFLARTMISGLEPLPASAVAGHGDVQCLSLVQAVWWSEIAERAEVFADDVLCHHRVVFHPEGMRRFFENWEEFAAAYLQTVLRERLRNPERGEKVLREILDLTPVPSAWLEMNADFTDLGDIALRRSTKLGTVNLRYSTFSIVHPSTIHPEMVVNCLRPSDRRSAAILETLHRLTRPEDVHKRLRPALSGKTAIGTELLLSSDKVRIEVPAQIGLPKPLLSHSPDEETPATLPGGRKDLRAARCR